MTDIQNNLTGRACDASPAARSCQLQCKPRFLTGRTREHANRGCSPMFACLRRILPSPAEAGFKPPHYRLERNEDNRGLRPRRVMYFLAAKSTDRSLRLVLFAAFWSAVNRGLRPRRVMYFLTAKSTKNSPADAFAYFVPANVRNGRLFAGLQANRPRFLPLLAGTSFDGSASGRIHSPPEAA